MWPYEMAQDPHLTGIGICYDGTNMRHRHIQSGVVTFIFYRPNPKHDAFGNIKYERSKESGPLVYALAVNKISKRLVQNNGHHFVLENPLNLVMSLKLSGC